MPVSSERAWQTQHTEPISLNKGQEIHITEKGLEV